MYTITLRQSGSHAARSDRGPGQSGDDESQPLTIARFEEMQDRPQNGTANIYWMRAAVIDELRETAYRGTR